MLNIYFLVQAIQVALFPRNAMAGKIVDPRDYNFSVLKEKIVEHLFVGELLKLLWRSSGDQVADVEIMKSEFDAHGYDIVLSFGPVIRHLQIKTGRQKRPGSIRVSTRLATKEGGCLLWIGVDEQLNLRTFYWYGEPPGAPLKIEASFKVPKGHRTQDGKRTTRHAHRLIPAKSFTKLDNIEGVACRLFGAETLGLTA